ncbi:MAG TPA: hypothetical protein VME70_10815 [Mycobacteriales bacterium]|nr:hypothetical protein [Mycobacteriales bacterium]
MTGSRHRLALGLAVAAVATVMPGAAVAADRSTAPHAAGKATTICVALVVDARSLGSDVSTSCAKVHKGATGVDVLQAAGHSVGFRSDGLLCTIDGLPKSGCADIDDTHYWAYFHRAPGSTKWVYSSEGPSTYQPVNKSTEGWVYDDGTPRTPDNVPYAEICKPAASASPTASPSPHPSAHHSQPSSSPSAAVSSRTAAPSASPPTKHRSKGRGSDHRSKPRMHATPAGSAPSASPSSVVLSGTVRAAGHTDWIPIVIGLVAIAVIGGLAVRRFRRSGRLP